jgi:hypothetical protein
MMTVIIDNRDPILFALELKSPVRVLEFCECLGDLLKWISSSNATAVAASAL